MKTIYLFTEKGWTPFDYESDEIQNELKKRSINIGDWVHIGDGAKIGYRAHIIKSLFITGTKNSLNWYGTGIIHIGCHKKEIDWWVKNYKDIGKKEGYSEDEIEEYFEYIKICERMQKTIKTK